MVRLRALRAHGLRHFLFRERVVVISLGSGYGATRVLDALLGAAVGVAVNLVVVPPLHLTPAGEALANVAEVRAGVRVAAGRDPAGDPRGRPGWWTAPGRSTLSSPSGNRGTQAGAEGRAGVRSIILHAPVLLFVPAMTVADPHEPRPRSIGFAQIHRRSFGRGT